MKSKLHDRAVENKYGGFYSKKYRKFEIFLFFYFIDLFQTKDKGGQNSFSLWKIFFGPVSYVLSFPKWRKTMEILKICVFYDISKIIG